MDKALYYKDFFDLLSYSNTGDLDQYNRMNVITELNYYLEHPNNSVYDIIDYEKLIYFEIRFGDDEEIMNKLTTLKYIICKNYILRKKLLHRLGAYD